MAQRHSVAEARQKFTELLRRAERGRAQEITRRGRPVAVLVSAQDYAALAGGRSSFREALAAFRGKIGDRGRLPDQALAGLRDRSPGRNVAR